MSNELTNRKWKVLHSQYLIKRGNWLTVREEKVQLPNHNIIPNWYIMEYPDWINVIALTENGNMVIIDQYRHAIGTTDYELVAGVVDDGETPLHAAQRELMEETGYGNGEWTLFMTTAPNPTNQTNHSYTFLATGVQQLDKPHQEPSEDIQVHLLTPSEVLNLMQQGNIIQALHLAPLYKYFCTHPIH